MAVAVHAACAGFCHHRCMQRVASIILATGFSLAAAFLSVAWLQPAARPACAGHTDRLEPNSIATPVSLATRAIGDGEAEEGAVDAATLKGLWSRHPDESGREDAPVAFYYFHDGGIGLYRYGQIGHNTTHSYRWAVGEHHGATLLVLTYNKTGEVQHLQVRLEQDGRRTLVIHRDPKNPGVAESRYFFVPPPSSLALAPDMVEPAAPWSSSSSASSWSSSSSSSSGGIDDRLWIDERRFKTGGMAFSLYQLRKAGIDGRGTGWHHVGDYDDWSTESLSYRQLRGDGGVDRLDLAFPLRGDRTTTGVWVTVDAAGKRSLTLAHDPRDFGARHTFKDGGPSFAVFARGGTAP
jgi:hypothetical protein